MNCDLILQDLHFQCRPVSDSVFYVESPFSHGFDGDLLGAYVISFGDGMIRVTDNADLLFNAMVNGVTPSASSGKRFRIVAEKAGISLSDDGELYAVGSAADASALTARLLEASIKIADACTNMRTHEGSRFEAIVGKRLRAAYGARVKAKPEIAGATGHILRFPFMVESDTAPPAYVQSISSIENHPHWVSVYSAVGKMIDLRNASPDVGRFTIMENASEESLTQARSILSESSSVLVYSDDMLLPIAA